MICAAVNINGSQTLPCKAVKKHLAHTVSSKLGMFKMKTQEYCILTMTWVFEKEILTLF